MKNVFHHAQGAYHQDELEFDKVNAYGIHSKDISCDFQSYVLLQCDFLDYLKGYRFT